MKKKKQQQQQNVKKVGTQVQFFQHDQISDLRWPDNKKENGMIKCIIAYPHKQLNKRWLLSYDFLLHLRKSGQRRSIS